MAHALQIDTLEFANNLKAAGADDRLANAIVNGITSADTSELATKSDLRDVEVALKSDMAELKTDMADLKVEIKESQNTLIKWMVGSMIALGGLIIASNLI